MESEQLLNGRYRLIEVIGSGGMSVVWRAHDEVLGRTVAVKVLAQTPDVDESVRRSMLAEARSAAMLSHPNLTNVFDYGEALDADGQSEPFVVMELLTGPTLANRIAEAPLTPREAMTICAQVADAVAAAHTRGIVHRDIKPSNIILAADGPKVLDFGIAAPAGAPDLDATGQLVGTPAYLAPERLTGEGVSPASDVFALGVLIYRLLARDLPWSSESASETLLAHLTVEPRPLPTVKGVPREVHDLYRRCLAKDPVQRPTASEVAAVLAAAVATRPPVPAGADEPITLPLAAGVAVNHRRRRVLQVTTASLALVAVLAVALVALASGGGGGATAGPAPTPPAETSEAETGAAPPTSPPTGGTEATVAPIALPPPKTPVRTTPSTTGLTTEAVAALGGTIHVLCQGQNATLLATQPATGYVIHDQVGGPAKEVKVVLRSSEHQSEIKAKCGPAGVIPEVRESDR